MVRRYRRSYRSNRDKYSVENTSLATPVVSDWPDVASNPYTQPSKQINFQVIPPSDVQGMRKVKHITLSFSSNSDTRTYYALVYVPAGYEPNPINTPAQGQAISLYEPNQYVMASGVLDFSGGPLRIRTPLARNLNSGDSLALVMSTPSAQVNEDSQILVNIQYAITLQ